MSIINFFCKHIHAHTDEQTICKILVDWEAAKWMNDKHKWKAYLNLFYCKVGHKGTHKRTSDITHFNFKKIKKKKRVNWVKLRAFG